MADLRSALDEHGWLVVSGPREAVSTVGLTAERLPELAVVGLPGDVGGPLLHELAERLLAGVPLSAQDELLGGLVEDDGALQLRLVAAPEGLPARQVYDDVQLLQLLWSDATGAFPGDPAFAHDDLQPALPPVEAPADWPLPDDPHAEVLTSPAVEQGAPVLMVLRLDDGELRFLDGASDFDPDTATVECLHDAVERDLSLLDAVLLAQPGTVAERDAPGAPWRAVPW